MKRITERALDEATERWFENAPEQKYVYCGVECYNSLQRLALTMHMRYEWRRFYGKYRARAKTKSALLFYKDGEAYIEYFDGNHLCMEWFSPADIVRHNEEVKRKYPLRSDTCES